MDTMPDLSLSTRQKELHAQTVGDKRFSHLDLFSGIGGFALAVDTVWPGSTHTFVDNDSFCQAILKKHWPNSPIYGDIRTFITDTESKRLIPEDEYEDYREKGGGGRRRISTRKNEIYILTGGFPCQPFSQAGRRKGTEDNRYLWPEMFRVIQLTQPTYVIAENVRGLLTISEGLVFEQVCTDLEGEGYEVQPIIIPAVAVNAPHRRDRIWFVAFNTKHDGRNGSQDGQGGTTGSDNHQARQDEVQQPPRPDRQGDDAANARRKHPYPEKNQQELEGKRSDELRSKQSRNYDWNRNWIEVATELCRMDARVSTWVDGRGKVRNSRNERLKALGNAIVPAVAVQIMRAIDSGNA